jgi:CheY-like chemotaxis protein
VQRQSPQFILLDMAMPVMDGPAFLDAYCPSHAHVPIIAFSAHFNLLHQLACAAAFLAKPFDIEALLLVGQYTPR